jgi:hypothetical protein
MTPKLTNEQKAFVADAASLGPVGLVEYRGQEPEVVAYVDKETGRKRFIPKHNLALEWLTNGDQVPSEYYVPRTDAVPKDQDQAAPPLPEALKLERGELCLVEITGYVQKAGVITCRISRIYPLSEVGRELRKSDAELPDFARTYVLKTPSSKP